MTGPTGPRGASGVRTGTPQALLIEPYFAGSHAEWASGYRMHSAFDVRLLALPGRFWKWRMHGAAVTLARRFAAGDAKPDVVVATDMLDLAAFLGLSRRRLAGVPVALYMHENQLAYPALEPESHWPEDRCRRAARRDAHYAFVNLTSALAADAVLWNSEHNRASFLDGLPAFLRQFPDFREASAVRRIAAKSSVLPVGIDLAALDRHRPSGRRPGPARIVWNHRWEHDKGPEAFFSALERLAVVGEPFEVVVLGASFGRTPPVFARARQRLGERIVHFGYVADRGSYARWLWDGDVVVSTARHEFFGVSVCEAIYCGCHPVLPDALSYPGLVPAECRGDVLYADDASLVARLQDALRRPRPALTRRMREHVAELDWSRLAPRYDETLAGLGAPVTSGSSRNTIGAP